MKTFAKLKKSPGSKSSFVSHKDNRLHYTKAGTGTSAMLVFHGFGQDNSIFNLLPERYGETYTFYLFDLFYHGKSERSDRILSKKEWRRIIQIFLKQEKISRFSIMAFSLGGRFGLAAAYEFADQVDEIRLIAPDGILISIWYKFSTSLILKSLFRYFMRHPSSFFSFLNFLEKYRLVNRTLIQFARKELGPEDSRVKVYKSWVYFKPLKYENDQIIEVLMKNTPRIQLLLGSKDRIIYPSEVQEKWKNVPGIEYHIVPAKHHELVAERYLRLLFDS